MKRHQSVTGIIIISSLLISGCDNEPVPKANTAVHVATLSAKSQPVALTAELPGRTSAWRIAEVRPQVSGIIEKRLFIEGSDVVEGQPLYLIDASLYKAAYNKASANLVNTGHLRKRYGELLKGNVISRQNYDDADSAFLQAKADHETARVNLEYTKVRSPITGRIGRSSITEGALVTANQHDVLAEVQQLDPMYVDFTQSSVEMLRLKEAIKSGAIKTESSAEAEVSLRLEDGSLYEQKGKLKFSEVSVDRSTGTVTLRAIFPNPERKLLPGMFVHAGLSEGIKESAYLIPQQAVTHDPLGQAKCWIMKGGKAEAVTIKTERTIGADWLVTAGIHENDNIIIKGIQKLNPGMNVIADK